jgi:hypothetical protein
MDRCLTLGGIAPPGAMTIIFSLTRTTHMANVKTFNFSRPDPNAAFIGFNLQSDFQRLATAVATELGPAMVSKPADNSSYNLQFFGPAIRCNPPNSSDQELFDYFSQAYANHSWILNLEQSYHWNFSKIQPTGFLVYSAFSPQLYNLLIDGGGDIPASSSPYNWDPEDFFPICNTSNMSSCNLLDIRDTPVFYWIFLANEYLICTSSNASYEVYVEYVNGQQNIIQTNVESVNDWNMTDGPTDEPTGWYVAYFQALGNLIYGNVSINILVFEENLVGDELIVPYTLTPDSQSPVLTTGLIGCDEFLNTPWFNLSMRYDMNASQIFSNGSNIPNPNDTIATGVPSPYNFGGDPSMCRNKTIARALEDLAANITISMLSYPGVT